MKLILAFTLAAALSAMCIGASWADDVRLSKSGKAFNRIASFPVFENTDIGTESVAEIVAASDDGKTLVYTDSANEAIGFVDITYPSNPMPLGLLFVEGEPTSVGVAGPYALAAVNTSLNFVTISGELVVIDIASQTEVTRIDLGGQPDAVAVSPDQRYAAIAIENERDEDLGDGEPPQAPAGFVVIVDLLDAPSEWTTRTVSLDGVADLFANDAEPEYIDINDHNVAVVTLQENNHIVLIDLKTGIITADFSAGTVNLEAIDATEEDPALISLTEAQMNVAREPDGVTWISNELFATADEGDLFGGSRGFTIFNTRGKVKMSSGSSNDHLAVRLGHYPDDRSGNKGNEPENVEYARFGKHEYLFVGSERASLIFVYELNKKGKPVYRQTLPAGVAPEGLLAIPQRGLFIAASEDDDRGDKFRSVLNIYQWQRGRPNYPTIISKNRSDNTPIPWGALSSLAVNPKKPHRAYTIHDSFYQQSRIYTMNIARKPARIKGEIILRDSYGRLAAVQPESVNADGTVNLDQEGIALRKGGFWIVSEGDDAPVLLRNLLLKVSKYGSIEEVISLPESTRARLSRFGFEGVAQMGRHVYVAFQREWADDPGNHVRIGRYDTLSKHWAFYYYPIEDALSTNGGWVGLSDIVALGKNKFAVIERDNQGGTDAVIKRIYVFSLKGLTPLPDTTPGTAPNFPVVQKKYLRDLVPDIEKAGGAILEKIEGLAALPNGTALVINDNDGADDSNGETQLLRLKKVFQGY